VGYEKISLEGSMAKKKGGKEKQHNINPNNKKVKDMILEI
jgi:hypothetical protein